MRRPALISTLAVLALAAAPAIGSATSVPGPNGKLAFASGRVTADTPEGDKEARIWVADYPNGPPAEVTTMPAGLEVQHLNPSWSPDHTRIVYAAGKAGSGEYALWIVDLRNGAESEFAAAAPGQDHPAWSPDGTRIAYQSEGDLWVKGVAAGSLPVRLTETAPAEARPAWSPDGEALYYDRGAAPDRDLYAKRPPTPAGAEAPVLVGAADDWQPAVSPDGRRLCFTRGAAGEGADLWTVGSDGAGAAPFAATAKGELDCAFSPDGTRIAYTLGTAGAADLASRQADGSGPVLLEDLSAPVNFDGGADWATNFSPGCAAKTADLGVNGFTTISLSCTDPDFGYGAAPPAPMAIDPEAIVVSSQPSHGTLGAISLGGQVVYTPDHDFYGADTFTYSGGDGNSQGAPATVSIRVLRAAADRTAPRISGLKVSARRWRLGDRGATISRLPVGTTISVRLDEAARVSLRFERPRPGRRSGAGCVRPTVGNRGRRACRRFVAAGQISVPARVGLDRVRFQGRLDGSRSLTPGRYRVVAGAEDAAGNRAPALDGPTFTVLPR